MTKFHKIWPYSEMTRANIMGNPTFLKLKKRAPCPLDIYTNAKSQAYPYKTNNKNPFHPYIKRKNITTKKIVQNKIK